MALNMQDCPKSHVSPAQKTDPQGLNVSQYKQKAKQAAPAPVVAVSVHVPAANPGAKPCMVRAALVQACRPSADSLTNSLEQHARGQGVSSLIRSTTLQRPVGSA